MNRLSILVALLLAAPMAIIAQTKEQNYINVSYITNEGEKNFNLGHSAMEKEEKKIPLTPEEDKAYEKFHAVLKKVEDNIPLTPEESDVLGSFDETRESYWDILGGGCSWYCGDGGPIKIEASSRLASQGQNNYAEKNLHDLYYNTAWVEGVSGYGVGEWVKYTFRANNPRITNIHVVNGYVKSDAAWKNNSRVKKLKVYVNDKPYLILNLEDSRSDQDFEISPLTNSVEWTMKFEILEVYKGDKYDDTALSEIYFSGLDVHCFAADTKVLMADASQKDIANVAAGDNISIYDSKTNSLKSAVVKSVATARHHNLVTYEFADGQTITATADHPFLLKEKGWASSNPAGTALYEGFETAQKIAVGDEFVTISGFAKLTKMTTVEDFQQTYTIETLSEGTNFVANGFVVGVETLRGASNLSANGDARR
ncbi:MAG: hypothetical protein J6T98_10285 [Salinivirgaceae bacterium]|nr:hypothetical protein [Salinivirgaceae bacterium]